MILIFLRRLRSLVWRAPDRILGKTDDPYLLRWYVWPRNRWFNLYLHHQVRSDADREFHNHPWWSLSFLVWGDYVDHTPAGRRHCRAPALIWRPLSCRHRIETTNPKGSWTLFLTGPVRQPWGFYCAKGWVPWQVFMGGQDNYGGDKPYPGCGED